MQHGCEKRSEWIIFFKKFYEKSTILFSFTLKKDDPLQ
jgi:hypothetical protein